MRGSARQIAMTAPIRLAIHGASGRVGQLLLGELRQDPRFVVIAALVRAASALCGTPVDGSPLRYQSEWPIFSEPIFSEPDFSGPGSIGPVLSASEPFDLIIDFSLPEALDQVLLAAQRSGAALVSGTTGLTPQQQHQLSEFAQRGRVLWASNFSLGAAVLAELSTQARRLLPAQFDAAVLEAHHKQKLDAPSGTALSLGKALSAVDGINPEYASVRAGRIVGEHTEYLAGPYERLELTHRADDRRVFAYGALAAGAWLVGQPPGQYTVRDWLFSGVTRQ